MGYSACATQRPDKLFLLILPGSGEPEHGLLYSPGSILLCGASHIPGYLFSLDNIKNLKQVPRELLLVILAFEFSL